MSGKSFHRNLLIVACRQVFRLVPLSPSRPTLRRTCFKFSLASCFTLKCFFHVAPPVDHQSPGSSLLSSHSEQVRIIIIMVIKVPIRCHCRPRPPLWLRPARLCFSPGSWGCDGWPAWCTAAVWNTPWAHPWSTRRLCHPVGGEFQSQMTDSPWFSHDDPVVI